MPCQQCGGPSIVKMDTDNGDVLLCLNCYERLEAIRDRELEAHERHINYLAEQFDHISGVPGTPRYAPRKPVVQVRGATFNTISIRDSAVGVANIGPLRQVDTAVTAIQNGPDGELADALATLAKAITESQMDDAQRVEALQMLAALSEEGARPAKERRKGVAATLMHGLREVLSVSADVATVAAPLWPLIAAAFGVSAN